MAGRPTEWSSIIETSASSLPAWPNAGQYFVTGASRSSWPRSAAMWAHSAEAPLVEEKTMETVSLRHGSPSTALRPPQTSMTVLPSIVMETLAPTSPRLSKFSAKASSTPRNFGSQWPSIPPWEVFSDTESMVSPSGGRFVMRC